MYPEFNVCEHHHIAYLVMRKCGCSSIKHAMSKIRDEQPLNADQIEIHQARRNCCLLATALPNPENWFKFTLVRDPIARFLSFYSSKILNQNLAENHTFLKYDRFGLLPNMSIDQVLDTLNDSSFETEPHAALQTDWLAAVGYELDYVGRLESLTASLNEIFTRTGARLQPKQLNGAKQKYVLPTNNQFERLVRFYRRDIEALGYPDNFQRWYEKNVDGNEDRYLLEPGFTFEQEAKLLTHSITRSPRGCQIEMKWRVHPHHRRDRFIRVGVQKGKQFEELLRIPASNLRASYGSQRIVTESVTIPWDNLPVHVDLKDVYHQLYFSDGSSRAPLADYAGHNNMLLMPFGQLQHANVARAA